MGSPEKVQSNINIGVTARTFQFLNGNNLTGLSLDVTKQTPKTSYFGACFAGNDFGNKQPCAVLLGSVEGKYNNSNNKVWLSQELYGEAMKEKGIFDSKLTYTPLKTNAQLGKVNISFDPRVAVHFNKDGLTPQVETLTIAAAPLTRNNKLSAFALFQTYDTTHSLSKDNISINAGLSYTF